MRLRYFVTLVYTYETRLRSPYRLVELFGGELLPIILMVFLLTNRDFGNLFSASFVSFATFQVIFYFLFFSIYEIGYFFNDCVAARKESRPTARFENCKELKYVPYFRVAAFLSICYLIRILIPYSAISFSFYCFLGLALSLLHSNQDVKERGLTYFWTEFFRLTAILSPFINSMQPMVIALLIIIPEILRRTLRYLRFKHLDIDRKFGYFDLKVIILSTPMVSVFLCQLDPFYLLPLAIFYTPILLGIVLSKNLDDRNPSKNQRARALATAKGLSKLIK